MITYSGTETLSFHFVIHERQVMHDLFNIVDLGFVVIGDAVLLDFDGNVTSFILEVGMFDLFH